MDDIVNLDDSLDGSVSSDTANENVATPDQSKPKLQVNRAAFDEFLETADSTEHIPIEQDIQQTLPKASIKIIEKARNYQQELFEKAKEENVIAVLDTGSGKTLIACLLIRYVLEEELVQRFNGRPPKIAVFMANSVHLVRQQAGVLASNIAVSPIVLCGNDKLDEWKQKSFWENLMQQNTVLVCTPAILQQCCDGAHLLINQISLLVFDEAHHAKKNHPYSRIMRTHYMKCKLDERPKVFGMTASPIDSKGKVDVNATDLEELLHSKIITTTDLSIMSFAPKPQDVIWRYPRPMQQFNCMLTDQLKSMCGFLDETRRGFQFADYATSILGPWCAEQAWKYVFNTDEDENTSIVRRYEQSQVYANIVDIDERNFQLSNLEKGFWLIKDHVEQNRIPDQCLLAPKVLRLKVELLVRFANDPDIRAIVFVSQRLTALVLHDCFLGLDIPNLRPGVLLGSSSTTADICAHRDTLDHFRAGLVNLVFATSVADEGIDIPQCNLCIRFDLYTTPIQYMQSRGRARATDSQYIHMIEHGNEAEENAVEYVMKSDEYIKDFCQSLPPDRLLGKGTRLERLLAQDAANKSFKSNSGAICDFGNCLMVLSNFATSLQYIGAVERESYQEHIDDEVQQFRYTVRLPCGTETQVKGARGEWRQNKQLAKRSAAFNCCFLLRRAGLLDEDLRSKYRKLKPENLNALLAVSQEKSSYPILTKPSAWLRDIGIVPQELFPTTIRFKSAEILCHPLAPLMLLTRHRLPQFPRFPIFLENNIQTYVCLEQLDHALPVSDSQLEALTKFTLDGVFLDVFNKQYEGNSSQMTYWLAPSKTHDGCPISSLSELVDLHAVERIQAGRIQWCETSDANHDWTNKFVCDPRNGKYHYLSSNIAKNLHALDPVPDTVPKVPSKSRSSIIDFSDSYWKASKKKFAASQWDPCQPVLHADLILPRRNFLERAAENQRMFTACYIAPQPLEVSRLDPSFAASCFVWPTIIHRLEAYMIALEGAHKVGLHRITPELALEAFTKDTDSDDLKNQTHFEGRHGMGKNYERLEFLGDSMLKMMTTITVFLRTNCDEEGMHCRRMEILCNRHLFDVSTQKHQLYQYVRAAGFKRDTWYPEHLTLLKGRGACNPPVPVKHNEVSQDLSKKTIADVSEALIGAAVITSQHKPRRFDLGIKLITTLVNSPDHAITSWSELTSMYEPPTWSLLSNDVIANNLATQIQERTGYKFNCPRLLRSAFTHSSDTNSTVPDLQRLEFLGDAVLDWVCISWLFSTNPDRNPQWLTEHKMAMVSNKFLATLAVTLDFDKFISATSINLLSDISKYARQVRTLHASNIPLDFWTEIDSPPKALSDLIESYLGAVLLDSSFNYTEIETFFNKHVLPFFKDINRYDGFASRHPTSYLHRKLAEYKCVAFSIMSSEPRQERTESSITAGILIHGKVVASAKAASANVAKVKASKAALELIEGISRDEFVVRFGCDCKTKDG